MPPSPDRIRRFSPGERWIHASLGTLMGLCVVTAAMLYWGPLSTLVGRREQSRPSDYTSGLLLPVPLVIGALASRAFRADVRRLDRFLPGDGRWLRSATAATGGSRQGSSTRGRS